MSWSQAVGWATARGVSSVIHLAAIIGIGWGATARAQAPPPPAGPADRDPFLRWVVVAQKERDFALRDDKQGVVRTGGGIWIYRVERADGPRLWLQAIAPKGPSGWARADQVVAIEQAEDYFAGRIRANPKDAFAYFMRAIVPEPAFIYGEPARPLAPDWTRKALADLDEAIRLEPGNAAAHYEPRSRRARPAAGPGSGRGRSMRSRSGRCWPRPARGFSAKSGSSVTGSPAAGTL